MDVAVVKTGARAAARCIPGPNGARSIAAAVWAVVRLSAVVTVTTVATGGDVAGVWPKDFQFDA